jgi:hypothetical protein
MRYLRSALSVAACFAGLLFTAGALSAGEKKLMHCFIFTPIEAATEADWQAFYNASDELPGKIPGLSHVWYGKLARNLTIFSVAPEARKKLAAGEKSATGEVTQQVRKFGVCMEFQSESALKVYADHPAHKEWETVYSKVRQYGTNTFDIIGQ